MADETYAGLVKLVLEKGESRDDRTGTGTIGIFGAQARFDLSKGFPILTTKRVYWKGVVEELLWFIAGSTNAKLLSEKGVKIWDGNGSRQFLDSRGLTGYEEGELGPVYGFQWRKFGAEYNSADGEENAQKTGVDQLAECIRQIRQDPNSRRIVVSAWNPVDLPKMALPPCHVLCQFYVANGKLSCQLYPRSADLGLGVPFNIASYALLTHMIAHICHLQVGEFIHSFGDLHIYKDHVDALKEQITRKPFPLPALEIRGDASEIDDFTAANFVLRDYVSHPSIPMKMAI